MGKRDRNERRGARRQFDEREARKQADRMENDGLDQGGDFNIWYGPRKKRRGTEKAPSRCDPDLDAGATRGSEAGTREFCVFFARGACARGYSCHKLHFVPAQEDDAGEDNTHDCFGRERSGADDDDRDGVGCFLKENRTLWLGGVPVIDEASARERVRQNFEAWGRISSVRLVKNKSCAFVQYSHRANAEFAKEAMSNQALLSREQAASSRAAAVKGQARNKVSGPRRPPSSPSSFSAGGGGGGGRGSGGGGGGGGASMGVGEEGPVLHVRWAAEDPNPRAVLRAREVHAQTLLAAQVATGALPRDVTGRLPGADRALLRKMGMNPNDPAQVDVDFQNTQRQYLAVQAYGAQGQYPNTDHQYPNTDHQYPNAIQRHSGGGHQHPNTEGQYPSTEPRHPGSAGRQYPSTHHQYPDTDHQYPNTDHEYPSTDHQYSNTGHQYPNTDHQYPNTDHQYPNTDYQYLSTSNQHLSTDHQHPSTADQYPNTDHQYPITDHQYPSAAQGCSRVNAAAAAAGVGSTARPSPPTNVKDNNNVADGGGNAANAAESVATPTSSSIASPSRSTSNTPLSSRRGRPHGETGEAGDDVPGSGGAMPTVGTGGLPPEGHQKGGSWSVAPGEAAGETAGGVGRPVAGGALSLLGGYGSDDSE